MKDWCTHTASWLSRTRTPRRLDPLHLGERGQAGQQRRQAAGRQRDRHAPGVARGGRRHRCPVPPEARARGRRTRRRRARRARRVGGDRFGQPPRLPATPCSAREARPATPRREAGARCPRPRARGARGSRSSAARRAHPQPRGGERGAAVGGQRLTGDGAVRGSAVRADERRRSGGLPFRAEGPARRGAARGPRRRGSAWWPAEKSYSGEAHGGNIGRSSPIACVASAIIEVGSRRGTPWRPGRSSFLYWWRCWPSRNAGPGWSCEAR